MQTAIVGGYGNTGQRLVQLLLMHTDDKVCLLARDPVAAGRFVSTLSQAEQGRVTITPFDAHQLPYADEHLSQIHYLFICAAVGKQLWSLVEWAHRNGVNVFESTLSSESKTLQLEQLAEQWKQTAASGHSQAALIVDGGYHPGLPGAMVQAMREQYGPLRKAIIGGSFRLPWGRLHFSPSTELDFARELAHMSGSFYQQGQWQQSISAYQPFDFGGRIGKASCVPMYLGELTQLPKRYPELDELGFYIAGFSPLLDYLVMPLCMVAVKVLPMRWVSRFFVWSLRNLTPDQQWASLQIEVETVAGLTHRVQLIHDDPYALTAIPLFLAMQQHRHQPFEGVHFQADCLPSRTLWDSLAGLGVTIRA